MFRGRGLLRDGVVNNDFFRRSARRRRQLSTSALHRSRSLLNIGRQLFPEPIHIGNVVAQSCQLFALPRTGGEQRIQRLADHGQVFIQLEGRGDASTGGLGIVNQIGHRKLEIAAQRGCHLALLDIISPPECDPVKLPARLLQVREVLAGCRGRAHQLSQDCIQVACNWRR